MKFGVHAHTTGQRAAVCLVTVAQPLLAGVPARAREWQPILELVVVVWNGVVNLQPKSIIAAELRRLFGPVSDAGSIVDLIAARKCELYPDEIFLVRDVVARESPRRLWVTASVSAQGRTTLRTAV